MNRLNIARTLLAIAAGALGLLLALPVVVLLLPFWALGSLTRGLRRYLEPRPVPWDQLIEYHPVVGWKPKANLDAYALDFNGDAYHLTTDDFGWRGRGSLEDSDVVVFGDSYAFGCGVDDAAFFAHLSSEVSIKAIGAPAYSMVQPVLWMAKYAAELAGKLVVWLVYPGNDLDDSLRPSLLEYRAPFVRRDGTDRWEVFSDHVDPSRWVIDWKEGGLKGLIEICGPTYRSKRVFEAGEYLVQRARNVCRDSGARLVVMTVPDLSPLARRELARLLAADGDRARFDEDLPDCKFRQICERLGVEFVALKDHLGSGDYLENDFHWNPRGHRRVAELIQSLYQDHVSAEGSSPPDERLESELVGTRERAAE